MDSERRDGESESRHHCELRLTRLNRALLCILGFVVALIVFAISSTNGMIDPFTHGFVSTTVLMLRNGSLQLSSSAGQNIPGSYFLMAQVALLTGIKPAVLEYLPLAGLGAFAATFLLGLQLLKNSVVAVFVADVLTCEFFGVSIFSVWPHAFGFVLFICFLAVLALRGPRTPAKLVVLWLIFVAIQVYSYTAELWAVSFVIFAQAYGLLARRYGRPGESQRAAIPFSGAISAAMIVTFLGLNQMIYNQYLPALRAYQGDFSTSLSYYFALLFRAGPPVPYAWTPPPTSPVIIVIHIAWLALAFAPFLLVVPPFRKRAAPSADEEPNQFRLFAGGLTFIWIVDVATYSTLGGFGATLLRVPTLAAPFLALILVGRLRRRTDTRIFDRGRVLAMYAAVFVIVSFASFGLAVGAGSYVTSTSHYEHSDNGALWLSSNAPWATFVLSDLNTMGEYSIVYATQGRSFEPAHVYTLDSYSHLVDPRFAAGTDSYFSNQYIVVNLELGHSRTSAGGWLDFEPLAPHIPTIESNVNLGLVYADGNSDIFLGMSS